MCVKERGVFAVLAKISIDSIRLFCPRAGKVRLMSASVAMRIASPQVRSRLESPSSRETAFVRRSGILVIPIERSATGALVEGYVAAEG